MKKALGIFGLLLFICVATALMSDRFLTDYNIENLQPYPVTVYST